MLHPRAGRAQQFSQRGFIETRAFVYPQTTPADSTHVVAEALARYEPSVRPRSWLRIAGAFDARMDTHDQVTQSWNVDWQDRTILRPALSVRRLDAIANVGWLTLDVGKQFIRWGKADILNPTDRFAPRDFLAVTDSEFLGVTAGRVAYERANRTLEAVWVPHFTPSRIPLSDQRWSGLPDSLAGVPVDDQGTRFPGGSQIGVRWNHLAPGFEYSLSFYDGFNNLPLIDPRPDPVAGTLHLRRVFPDLRMYGGDVAVPLRWFTVKSEAAYFSSPDSGPPPLADDYVLYVIQLERQAGEWSIVGGYAGEVIVTRRSALDFAPDRGLTRSFLGRASYTIDTNRSLAIETAVRQNGDGTWVKGEYSQASGRHWRTTATITWIRGDPTDFIGQYNRNSHAGLRVRYSF